MDSRQPPTHTTPAIALKGCRIDRVLENAVEIVHALPGNRSFPDRVNDSLGICLKAGPEHEARADGRPLRYPANAICVRAPGTVWSTPATGPAGFLSIDIEPSLLPESRLTGRMRFVEPSALPDLRTHIALLRSGAPTLDKEIVVAELVSAVVSAGFVLGEEGETRGRIALAVDRARELLTSRIADPPTLQELADAVGANRFVLLREFRRRVGVPPRAFLLGLRVERARQLLARGADLSTTALDLGFADQPHFNRIFKRFVGMPPGEYRRQMRSVIPRSIAFKT